MTSNSAKAQGIDFYSSLTLKNELYPYYMAKHQRII